MQDTAGEGINEHISVIIPWTPSHGQANIGRPARTYQQQLSTDTGCSLENLPEDEC